jgi:hypothetical protein
MHKDAVEDVGSTLGCGMRVKVGGSGVMVGSPHGSGANPLKSLQTLLSRALKKFHTPGLTTAGKTRIVHQPLPLRIEGGIDKLCSILVIHPALYQARKVSIFRVANPRESMPCASLALR